MCVSREHAALWEAACACYRRRSIRGWKRASCSIRHGQSLCAPGVVLGPSRPTGTAVVTRESRLALTMAAATLGDRKTSHGKEGPSVGDQLPLPFLELIPRSICTSINSDLSTGRGTSSTQIITKSSVRMGIAIRHTRELFKFFKELRTSGYENCCHVAK